MQTADWALVISLCSAAISLAGLAWNVWSKFIYPKPRVRVSFTMMTLMQLGRENQRVLSLSATNMGPSEVTLYTALTIKPMWPFRPEYPFQLLQPLHNFPVNRATNGVFSGGLPKKLAVGEMFTVHFIPDHESLAKGDYQRIGFSDTFGRHHWAPRRHILDALPLIREECQKFGKDWRRGC